MNNKQVYQGEDNTMDDLLIALHQSARRAKGGISGLAKRHGWREQTTINKLNPADDHHQPKIGEFVAIIQDTGDTTPVDVLCGIFGGRFVTRSNDRKPTLMAAVLHAMSEHSDIARAIEDALADNVITPTERMAIYRQIAEARQALVTLENTLAADNVIVIEPPKGA